MVDQAANRRRRRYRFAQRYLDDQSGRLAMVEQWYQRVRRGLAPVAERTAARIRRLRPGTWTGLLVVAALACREGSILCRRLAGHRAEIADAIGSVGFFYGPPQPNRPGSQVLYLRTSEKGLSLYVCDVASGEKTRLKEWEAPQVRSMRGQALLPLSPDERYLPLVFSVQASPGALVIGDIASMTELIRI